MEEFHTIYFRDVATCGGTLTYKHDEPTSFFFFALSIPFLLVALALPCGSLSIKSFFLYPWGDAAHRRLSRRPSLLGGGVAATKPAGDQEGKAARKRRAGGTALGTSAQHAKEGVQPRRSDWDREMQKTLWYKD